MRLAILAGPTLATLLVLTISSQPRADEPLQFAPDEIARPDGGAPDDLAPPPDLTPSPAPSPTPTPAPPPAIVSPDKAPRALPRITVHAWEPEKATLFAPEEAVEAAMGDVLAEDHRLRFSPFATLLAVDDSQAKLAQADNDTQAAQKALVEMDLDRAQPLLEAALKTYQRYLPQLALRPDGTTPMRDAWIAMAKTRFFQGNADGARDALRYVFVLDNKLTFNKEQFPPQMKKLVTDARLVFDSLGAGKLTIDSDPPGATVWLDGKKLAQPAPTDPIDAPPGPNYISFARRGYAPMTLVFVVGGGGEAARAGQTLERYANNPLSPIDRARAHIDDAHAPATLKEASNLLGMDLLALVRLERPGLDADEKPSQLVAYLYDARSDRVLTRVTQPVAADLGQAAATLARALVADVPLDGSIASPPSSPRPRRASWSARFAAGARHDFGRFYHWKGFWYVVGGVAVLAAAGIAGGLGARAAEDQQLARQRQNGIGIVLIGGN